MSRAGPGIQTVAQLLAQRVRLSPDEVAFQIEDAKGDWQPTRWQGFAARVAVLSKGLHAAGLRRGNILAILSPISLEWELLHHAALTMGVAVVGMDAHDLPDRIARMAAQLDIVAFATTDIRLLAKLGSDKLGAKQLLIALETTAGADQPWPKGPRRLALADLVAMGTSAGDPFSGPQPDDAAAIIFTSGTTGVPKGISYTHAQVCMAIEAICDVFAFVDSSSRLLCWLPLSNLFQRIVNLAAMRQGAATYLLADPRDIMRAVQGVSPDIFIGVPRFYEKLYGGIVQNIAAQPRLVRLLIGTAWNLGRRVSRLSLDGRTPPPWLRLAHLAASKALLQRVRGIMGTRLRCMVTGSAPTPRRLLEEMHALGWTVLEAYGLSENVLPMAMNRPDDFRFGTVGRPIAGNDVAIGEDGTVIVKGPCVFTGYIGAVTAPALDANGYYHTGDEGRFDSHGYLVLSGRNAEMIKTSTGRRLAPAAIEAQLQQAAGIDQAMVVGAGRKHLVALCTCVDSVDDAELPRLAAAITAQTAGLAEHERPRAVALIRRPFSIEHGELTTNLKLRRQFIEQQHAVVIDKLYTLLDQRDLRPHVDSGLIII